MEDPGQMTSLIQRDHVDISHPEPPGFAARQHCVYQKALSM